MKITRRQLRALINEALLNEDEFRPTQRFENRAKAYLYRRARNFYNNPAVRKSAAEMLKGLKEDLRYFIAAAEGTAAFMSATGIAPTVGGRELSWKDIGEIDFETALSDLAAAIVKGADSSGVHKAQRDHFKNAKSAGGASRYR